MDLHPIQSVHVSTHCDQNKVWIQRNTYQDIAVNEWFSLLQNTHWLEHNKIETFKEDDFTGEKNGVS